MGILDDNSLCFVWKDQVGLLPTEIRDSIEESVQIRALHLYQGSDTHLGLIEMDGNAEIVITGNIPLFPAEKIFTKSQRQRELGLGTGSSSKTGISTKLLVSTLEMESNADLIHEYKKIHREVWPEIIANMNQMGIEEMALYLHGFRAFLIMEVCDSFDMDQEAERWIELPKEREWQTFVSQFQGSSEAGDSLRKWQIMHPIMMKQ